MKIGIDLGTTNTKAIALSKDGEVLCELSNATVVNTVPTGGEMDPASLAQGFLSLLSDVITKAGNLTDERLEAIGLAGMAEAGCLVNSRYEPQTPVLLWYDRRGAEEAEELRTEYEDVLTSVSGIRMSNVATIYKLAYLKKHFPHLFTSGYRWIGVPEWAAWILKASL